LSRRAIEVRKSSDVNAPWAKTYSYAIPEREW
jgi:hypothetical protein